MPRHSLLVNTLAVVITRVADLTSGLGLTGVINCCRMFEVFDVTALLFLFAGKWCCKEVVVTSPGMLLAAEEVLEGVVISTSVNCYRTQYGNISEIVNY